MQIFKIAHVNLRVGIILSYFKNFWVNACSFPLLCEEKTVKYGSQNQKM